MPTRPPIVCGAYHKDLNRYDGSISKSMYICTNEGNWCENHGCNFSYFQGRPFKAGVEEKEQQKHDKMGGLGISARKSSDALQLLRGYCWVEECRYRNESVQERQDVQTYMYNPIPTIFYLQVTSF